jgi:hypothetical protein
MRRRLQKSALTARRSRGLALLALLAILTMGSLYLFIGNLNPQSNETIRQRKTMEALVEARDTLLGYISQYRDIQNLIDVANANSINNPVPGYLPLPDRGATTNNNAGTLFDYEGYAQTSMPSETGEIVGRFPWKQLETGPLRDGNNECLWYGVTASHREVGSSATVLNWDTLGLPEILIGSGKSVADSLATYDHPVAVIFSPDPAPATGRAKSAEAPLCDGNYIQAQYVSSPTNNQRTIPVTSDMVFGALRKNANFRNDINALLDRVVDCVGRNASTIAPGKIGGANNDPCYGDDQPPKKYFGHYRDLIFVSKPAAPFTATIDGVSQTCKALVVFANQRSSKVVTSPAVPQQRRTNVTEQGDRANYLEQPLLAAFLAGGTGAVGPSKFDRISSGQSEYQDIVRCVPNTTVDIVQSTALNAYGGQMTAIDTATGTLTLGKLYSLTSTQRTALANAMFGCAWIQPHTMGSGLRSYFKFRISDTGEGFTFAVVDGDLNGAGACGAARQHMGYSGNNGYTPSIVAPKIGVEIDTQRESTFNPAGTSNLSNGRNDPSYTGGHVGIVYWGGEATISTGLSPTCVSPRVNVGGVCHLPANEDDNVHGYPLNNAGRGNTCAPASPTLSAATYKLDPNLSGTPVNQDIHMRVEITRPTAASTLPAVRAGSTTNVSLVSPGTQIDGITLVLGDRLLLKTQTAAHENGVYLYQGATTRLVRVEDMDSASELTNAAVMVVEGSLSNTWWKQTQTITTLGVDALSWTQQTVRVATQANINIASPGSSVDSCNTALVSGDRVLVKAQTAAAQNGIYVWNGSSSAMTRATDTNSATELNRAITQVLDGPLAGSAWRQAATVATVNTDAVDWISQDAGPLYLVEAWVLADSGTDALRIAAMQDTSRPMRSLSPSFNAHVRNQHLIYYPFLNARIGFTTSQSGSSSARDQIISISNLFTTWLE